MPQNKIIIALDNIPFVKAQELSHQLSPFVYGFKINHTNLFDPRVRELVHHLHNQGKIMVDLKLHDTYFTNTSVINAFLAAYDMVEMMTIHLDNGLESIKYTQENKLSSFIQLVGITTLTSLAEFEVFDIYECPRADIVESQARTAVYAGLRGIVCAPKDIPGIVKNVEEDNYKLIKYCPGIRLEPDESQPNSATPKEALTLGADYLIIGRPITKSDDPVGAVRLFLDNMT